MAEDELLRYCGAPGFGHKALKEIKDIIADMGLSLGMSHRETWND